jgi:hypothetical protein
MTRELEDIERENAEAQIASIVVDTPDAWVLERRLRRLSTAQRAIVLDAIEATYMNELH